MPRSGGMACLDEASRPGHTLAVALVPFPRKIMSFAWANGRIGHNQRDLVLVGKRDKGGVGPTCLGVDFAEVSTAPKRHLIGVKSNFFNEDTEGVSNMEETLACDDFEFIKGFGDFVIADGPESRVIFSTGPQCDFSFWLHSMHSRSG
jgi:hypothetical protein